MTLLAHGFATALYLFAAFLGWTRRTARGGAAASRCVIAFATLLHAVGFYGLHLQKPPVPLSSFPAALSLIGWLLALAWLARAAPAAHARGGPVGRRCSPRRSRCRPSSACSSAQRSRRRRRSPSPGRTRTCCSAPRASALLALASLAGLGYLAKERALKRRAACALGAARAREPRSRAST